MNVCEWPALPYEDWREKRETLSVDTVGVDNREAAVGSILGPFRIQITEWSGRRGSNSRPLPWQGTVLILYSGGVKRASERVLTPNFHGNRR
jgi:hypothetical protein